MHLALWKAGLINLHVFFAKKGCSVSSLLKNLGFAALIVGAGAAGIASYYVLNDGQEQTVQNDFRTLSGDTFQWRNMQGQWTIINYFAPWCAPCLREMPELNALGQELPENTRLFAINYDIKTEQELKEMVEKFDIDIPVIVAERNTSLPMKRPPYLPATFIIGPQGKVADTIMGEVTADEIRQRLNALQSSKPRN